MKNRESGNNMSCRAYFTTGGLVGLLGVLISFFALLVEARKDPGSPSVPIVTIGAFSTSDQWPEPSVTYVDVVNVTGSWVTDSETGYVYRFTQNGNSVTLEEVAFNGLTTGYGEGYRRGNVIQIEFVAADGSMGAAEFVLMPSGDRMTGTFNNWTFGSTASLSLYRQ